MKHLKTSREVIEKLGGIYKVAELTKSQPKAVWNWQRFDSFPAVYMVVMTRALRRRKCWAHPTMWRQECLEAA